MKWESRKTRWMVITVVLTAVFALTLPLFTPRIRVKVQRTYLPVKEDNTLYLAILTDEPVENVRAIVEKRPELLQTYRFAKRPALVLAAERKRSDLVLLFLQMGADVNSRAGPDSASKDTTALHVAAQFDDVKTIEILLRYKADTKLLERYGRTAYQVAVDAGSKAAADALRETK